MGLSARRSAQLGIGDGDRPETGDGRQQRFFFRTKGTVLPRVNEDSAVGAGGAERSGQQHPGGDEVAQGMTHRIYGNRNGLSRGNGTQSQVGGKLKTSAVIAGPNR